MCILCIDSNEESSLHIKEVLGSFSFKNLNEVKARLLKTIKNISGENLDLDKKDILSYLRKFLFLLEEELMSR